MRGDVRIPTHGPTSSRRELTIYDTPEKRSPEDEARDRAKHIESHPFLYYLGQMVPGLQPGGPAEPAPDPSAGGPGAPGAVGRIASHGLDLWGREAVRGLFEEGWTQAGAAHADDPARESPGIPIIPPQLPPPQVVGPAQDAEASAPVAPVEIPRIVLAQVDRMVQGGTTASTIHVQLDPPHLGKVELAFTYAQHKVSVNVLAATQQARDHLEMQLANIRGILHAHNLPTGELKVVLAGESAGPQDGPGGREPGEQPQRYRRRRRAGSLDEAIARI